MLVRSNPFGYAFNEKLTSVQMNIADSQLPLAIDGRGGEYTATSVIKINGLGIWSSNFTKFGGNAFFEGCAVNFDIASPVGFDGPVVMNAGIEIDGAANFIGTDVVQFGGRSVVVSSGGEFTNYGPTYLNNDVAIISTAQLTCNGPAYFTNTINCLSSLSVTGAVGIASSLVVVGGATMSGGLSVGGAITSSGPMTFTGFGRLRKRAITGVNGNASYSAADADIIFVPPMPAGIQWVITNTGAVDGDMLIISGYANVINSLELAKQTGGSPAPVATMQNAIGGVVLAIVVFGSGTWNTVALIKA